MVLIYELFKAVQVGFVEGVAKFTTGFVGKVLFGERFFKQMMHAGDRVANRHSGEGVAVVAPLERKQLVFFFASNGVPVLDGHFNGHFYRN